MSNHENVSHATEIVPSRYAPPQATLNIGLTDESMVAIAVSRFESKHEVNLANAVAEAGKCDREANLVQEQLDKSVKETAIPEDLKAKVQKLLAAAAELGLDWVPEYQVGALVTRTRTIPIRLVLRGPDDKTIEVPALATQVGMLAQVEELKHRKAKHAAAAQDARTRLSRIGTIERRSRAALAEITARKTVEGSELLDSLLARIDAEAESIPTLKQLEG